MLGRQLFCAVWLFLSLCRGNGPLRLGLGACLAASARPLTQDDIRMAPMVGMRPLGARQRLYLAAFYGNGQRRSGHGRAGETLAPCRRLVCRVGVLCENGSQKYRLPAVPFSPVARPGLLSQSRGVAWRGSRREVKVLWCGMLPDGAISSPLCASEAPGMRPVLGFFRGVSVYWLSCASKALRRRK